MRTELAWLRKQPGIDPKRVEIQNQLADRSDWTVRDTAFVSADPADDARRVTVPALIVHAGQLADGGAQAG